MAERPSGIVERSTRVQDGRNINSLLGLLAGEGAHQEIERPDAEHPARRVLDEIPRSGEAAGTTYYGLPSIKEPVWIWTIPTYFFVGGLAGAANAFGAMAQVVSPKSLRHLVVRARWIGAVGDALSAVLLVSDLGKPARFLNMLRVMRVTSPMSIGSWVLAGCGAFSGASLLLSRANGPLRKVGDLAGFGAGLLGLPLAGYTGVLISNTAVPIWQGGRRTLPALFLASGAASAGSFLELICTEEKASNACRRFANAGKVAELVGGLVLEREVGKQTRAARPFRRGLPGMLWSLSRALTAASLVLSLAPPKARWKRTASALLGLGGALSLRFAIFEAGKASARDARAGFEQHRERLRARSPVGKAEEAAQIVGEQTLPAGSQPVY